MDIEKIKAEAKARLEASKRPDTIIMDDYKQGPDLSTALQRSKMAQILALTTNLANIDMVSRAKDRVLSIKDDIDNMTRSEYNLYAHRNHGGDRLHSNQRKAKRIRRIAKRSRQYNRRKQRGMSVNHLRKGI